MIRHCPIDGTLVAPAKLSERKQPSHSFFIKIIRQTANFVFHKVLKQMAKPKCFGINIGYFFHFFAQKVFV